MNQTDEQWMQEALRCAEAAKEAGEVPVGAVLVHEGELIARGYNQPIHQNDPTAHAEIQVLRAAGKILKNYRLPGTTLYVTLEPCPMCAMALVHARVERVVFGASDPRCGAGGSLFQLFDHEALNHRIIWESGVCSEACAKLLKDFFKAKRLKPQE